MALQKQQHVFLLLILGGALILTFFILQPFLLALAFAAAVSAVCQPLYRRVLTVVRNKPSIAAALTTLIVVLAISIPIGLIGTQLTREAADVYATLTKNGARDVLLSRADAFLQSTLPGVELNLAQYVRQAFAWLLPNLASVFSSSAKIALNTLVFLFALYYLLKDGKHLTQFMIDMSPLADTDDKKILIKLHAAVMAVVRGNLLIGIIQGAVATIGFFLFGLPNPILWGSVTAIAALIPGVGTALVLVPAVAYLLVTGDLFAALGLAIWGAAAVGLVDNLLGPRLLGHGTDLHPLLIFLAVLGGIALFGPLGILLGPIFISLLVTLLDLYATERKRT